MSRTNTIKTTTARRSEHRHSLRTNTIKVAIACPPVDQRSSTASGIANHCTRLSHQPSHQYHQQHNTTIATCITPCNSLVAPNTIELVPPQSHPQQHVSNPITKCNHRLHVSHLLCISAVVMHGTAYTAWLCNLAMQRKPPRLTSQGMHCGAACAPRARQHVCARTCKRSGSSGYVANDVRNASVHRCLAHDHSHVSCTAHRHTRGRQVRHHHRAA
jgi:hypothetical protein